MSEIAVVIGLGLIMGLVLILPFSVRWVEEELEAFLLVMGCLAVTMSGLWSWHLIREALTEPVKISAAVLAFGFLFRRWRDLIRNRVSQLARRLGLPYFLFALVVGLGAALTPIGEPLSTIATAKLSGPPHSAGFFFLARLLWPWIIAGIVFLGLLAAVLVGRRVRMEEGLIEDAPEDFLDITMRAAKVYAFVAALLLLGHGFTPLVDRYLVLMPEAVLYWLNMISAVLDNATLAAAEISPLMGLAKIRFFLMGLLVSGGMLIPGNIPNIICAGKFGITSREWTGLWVPLGLALMFVYFILLQVAAGSIGSAP
jgi:predicted cation transporter